MSSKREKLEVMAKRGGTANEREIAARLLKNSTMPAVPTEEAGDKWTGQGVLTRTRNGANAYLRGSALRYFLAQIKDGETITNRTIPLSDDFGSGDFYVILSWLLKHDLCLKNGSRYVVQSKKAVVAFWNASIDKMKF